MNEDKKLREMIDNAVPVSEPPRPDRDRVTVHFSLTHEQFGEQPFQRSCVFSRLLSSSEQAYSRSIRVGPGFSRLDFGWVQSPGIVLIENRTAHESVLQPPEDERKRLDDSYVVIADTTNGTGLQIVVRPGRFFVGEFSPDAPPSLCSVGLPESRVHVVVIPR